MAKIQLIIILVYSIKKVISEESPIDPRSESLFEVKNWTDLLKRKSGNQTVTFSKSAELFELKTDKEEKLIGKVDHHNGKLYNDEEDVSLCQRRVFKIKVQGGESDPIIWAPPNYQNVSYIH